MPTGGPPCLPRRSWLLSNQCWAKEEGGARIGRAGEAGYGEREWGTGRKCEERDGVVMKKERSDGLMVLKGD